MQRNKQKLIIVAVLTALLIIQSMAAEVTVPESVPVLSIGSIVSYSMGMKRNERGNSYAAIHDQLTSELLNKYDCRVLSRCRGYDVVVERSIDTLLNTKNQNVATPSLPSVDYVIFASFTSAHIDERAMGIVICSNTKTKNDSAEKKIEFTAANRFELAEAVADAIGKSLSLSNRRKAGTTPSQRKQIWAIFPFSRIKEQKALFDSEIAEKIELALQNETANVKLVDRNLFDKVLNEQKIKSLSGEMGITAAYIGNLLSADILVVGQISEWKKNYRLDIHILDAKNGCILNARVLKEIPQEQISAVAAKCVAELARTGLDIPTLPESSASERRHEAEILVSHDFNPQVINGGVEAIATSWNAFVNAHEGAYLLIKDDPVALYKNISTLTLGMEKVATSLARNNINTFLRLPGTSRATRLIEETLKTMEVTPAMPTVLIFRAENAMFTGKYEECLSLLEKHVREHPDLERDRARRIKAGCKLRTGKLDEAAELMKPDENSHCYDFYTLVTLRRITELKEERDEAKALEKDESEEYKTLESRFNSAMRHYETGSAVPEPVQFRYFELMRKYETPQQALQKAESFRQSLGTLACLFSGMHIVFPVNINNALCHLQLGEKKESAIICKHIIESFKTRHNFETALPPTIRKQAIETYEKAVEIYSNTVKEMGPVDDTWKTFGQTKTSPSNFVFYIVPFGKMNNKILEETTKILTTTFAMTVRILPETHISKEVFEPATGKFPDVNVLYPELLRSCPIPENAIFVAFVTGDGCMFPIDYSGKEYPFNPCLVTYQDLWRASDENSLQYTINGLSWRIMAFVINQEYKELYSQRGVNPANPDEIWIKKSGLRKIVGPCHNFPCILSGPLTQLPARMSHAWRLFTMCPECQEEYKKADFDKIHNDLMDCLKKAGAKIVKAEEIKAE